MLDVLVFQGNWLG